MVERLSEQRQAVTEFFEDSTRHYLTQCQRALLKAMITVLKIFEEVTHLLCMDNAMLGQALPFLTFIERTVKSTMEAAEQDTPAFDLASGLLSELNCSQHFISVKEDVMFFPATLLDPRFMDTVSTNGSKETT